MSTPRTQIMAARAHRPKKRSNFTKSQLRNQVNDNSLINTHHQNLPNTYIGVSPIKNYGQKNENSGVSNNNPNNFGRSVFIEKSKGLDLYTRANLHFQNKSRAQTPNQSFYKQIQARVINNNNNLSPSNIQRRKGQQVKQSQEGVNRIINFETSKNNPHARNVQQRSPIFSSQNNIPQIEKNSQVTNTIRHGSPSKNIFQTYGRRYTSPKPRMNSQRSSFDHRRGGNFSKIVNQANSRSSQSLIYQSLDNNFVARNNFTLQKREKNPTGRTPIFDKGSKMNYSSLQMIITPNKQLQMGSPFSSRINQKDSKVDVNSREIKNSENFRERGNGSRRVFQDRQQKLSQSTVINGKSRDKIQKSSNFDPFLSPTQFDSLKSQINDNRRSKTPSRLDKGGNNVRNQTPTQIERSKLQDTIKLFKELISGVQEEINLERKKNVQIQNSTRSTNDLKLELVEITKRQKKLKNLINKKRKEIVRLNHILEEEGFNSSKEIQILPEFKKNKQLKYKVKKLDKRLNKILKEKLQKRSDNTSVQIEREMEMIHRKYSHASYKAVKDLKAAIRQLEYSKKS